MFSAPVFVALPASPVCVLIAGPLFHCLMVLPFTIAVNVPVGLWFSTRMPPHWAQPELATAALPMKLFETCPCQVPPPLPSLMLIVPPATVPTSGVPAAPLFEMLKLTCSLLPALPPEMVTPPSSEPLKLPIEKKLPVKTMFSVALLLVAVWRWSPPAPVKVLLVTCAVTVAAPLGSMMILSLGALLNVEPSIVTLDVPLEFLIRKLSSIVPETARFVNVDVPSRPSKIRLPSSVPVLVPLVPPTVAYSTVKPVTLVP